MTNRVRVLLFASIREKFDEAELSVEIPQTITVLELRHLLGSKHPKIAIDINGALAAVNKEYANDRTQISDGDEVAFFPRVSGGSQDGQYPTICRIQSSEIVVQDLIAGIITPTTGAVCMFTGIVRAISSHPAVSYTEYLHYEAYEAMAEEMMRNIAREIREKWTDVEGVLIIQRIGRLDPGIPSVLIACASGHRDSGIFEAAKYGIDRLKEIVPIWKKDVGSKGQGWIEGQYDPTPQS